MPEFNVAGKASGQTLHLAGRTTVEMTARIEWTFPPAFAEVVWGDGNQVYRKRLDLSDSEPFCGRELRVAPSLVY